MKKIYQHLFDLPDSVGLLISLHRWQPHGCKLGSCECRRADLAIGHTGTLYMGGDDPQRCDMGLPGVQGVQGVHGDTSPFNNTFVRLTWFGRASLNDMASTWRIDMSNAPSRVILIYGTGQISNWMRLTFPAQVCPCFTVPGHITKKTICLLVEDKRKHLEAITIEDKRKHLETHVVLL